MANASCRCCGSAPHQGSALGRRGAFLGGLVAGLAVMVLPSAGASASSPVAHTTLSPDQALARLKDGNDQYQHEAPYSFAHTRARRLELALGQSPFAVLVGCSDSRVPPELLFGRGLGELFIVRNAGNTVDTAALGSIEYGVGVLGCPLVVVMGHEGCGAVAAAIEVVTRNSTFPGVIGEMIQPIIPAVLSVRDGSGTVSLNEAVIANARRVATRLTTQSVVLRDAISQGKLRVVAARYDLKEGDVSWFEDV
jgi:carbonic anhydrase